MYLRDNRERVRGRDGGKGARQTEKEEREGGMENVLLDAFNAIDVL